jgi:hypothetical protein
VLQPIVTINKRCREEKHISFYFKNIQDKSTQQVDAIYIYIYIDRERERELGYGATRSTDDPCATDYLSIFKVEMIDPTGQNIFHMKI